MNRAWSALVTIPLLWGALGCTRSATPYRSAMGSAEDARRDDRFDQERSHFAQAAQLAKKPKDAGEARYRRAHSWVREGKYERGAHELEKFAATYPSAIRAARAWLDAGRAWEKLDERQAALAAYRVVIEKYPESGNAQTAAKRVVALRVEAGEGEAHAIWRELLEANRSRTLDEELRYNYARSLEENSPKHAIITYEDVARRHPLPHGSYTDEALLRAAQLRRNLGDPKGALATLDLLLEQGGKAAFVGSYTRTAYVEGLMLRGKILRDDLDSPEAALKAFKALPKKYPNSRLIDDAFWQAVVTRRQLGETGCEELEKLREKDPHSRYLRCTDHFCQQRPAPERGRLECERWLESSSSDGE